MFQAVAKEEVGCYFVKDNLYIAEVYLDQYAVIFVVEQDRTGQWGLVRLPEFTDCWADLQSLDLKVDLNSLPFSPNPPPPIISSIIATQEVQSTIATQEAQSTAVPITLAWEVKSHYCNNDRHVESVTVDLDISGGVAPYITDPIMPITVPPGQALSVTVKSSTPNGEPSSIISFVVPGADNFKCASSGDNTDSPPDPVDPEPVDPDPVGPDPVDPDPGEPDPGEPDVCYNPQGHEIKCKNK
jgi:hypothetical protein